MTYLGVPDLGGTKNQIAISLSKQSQYRRADLILRRADVTSKRERAVDNFVSSSIVSKIERNN
jgi:hypothetical protein